MLEHFYTKRNCKLNGQFFHFLVRKIPSLKMTILGKCDELSKRNIRAAQKKQISKMQSKLGLKDTVKVKQEEIEE